MFQSNGTFTVYQYGQNYIPLWSINPTNPESESGSYNLSLKNNCSLLITNGKSQSIWTMNQATGQTECQLVLTDNGSFQIIDGNNNVLWNAYNANGNTDYFGPPYNGYTAPQPYICADIGKVS